MTDPLTEMTNRLQRVTGKAALMAAAYIGLELMERAGTALVELGPEENIPAYETAVRETADAARALAAAPSLAWPNGALPDATSAHEEFQSQLVTLSLAVHQALVAAATKAVNESDRVACLEAALHTGRVHQALR